MRMIMMVVRWARLLGDDVWLCLEVAANTIRSHIGNQDMFWKHIMMRWSDVIPASKAAPGQAVRTQTLMKGSACVPENDIKCNEGSIGSLVSSHGVDAALHSIGNLLSVRSDQFMMMEGTQDVPQGGKLTVPVASDQGVIEGRWAVGHGEAVGRRREGARRRVQCSPWHLERRREAAAEAGDAGAAVWYVSISRSSGSLSGPSSAAAPGLLLRLLLLHLLNLLLHLLLGSLEHYARSPHRTEEKVRSSATVDGIVRLHALRSWKTA